MRERGRQGPRGRRRCSRVPPFAPCRKQRDASRRHFLGFLRVANVRVAGSNPVSRSRKSERLRVVSSGAFSSSRCRRQAVSGRPGLPAWAGERSASSSFTGCIEGAPLDLVAGVLAEIHGDPMWLMEGERIRSRSQGRDDAPGRRLHGSRPRGTGPSRISRRFMTQLPQQVLRHGHTGQCRSGLEFAIQLVGNVSDLDHRHAQSVEPCK